MNNRGSVTIFSLLITTAIILAFFLYVNDIQKHMLYTNGLRRVERAGLNGMNTYNRNLYSSYGLLATDESSVEFDIEKTLRAELTNSSSKSLLPMSNVKQYTFRASKIHGFMDLDSTLDQMTSQATMQVPKSVLSDHDYVKALFEKAKNAKSKIKNIDSHMEKLKKLKSVNDKLGQAYRQVQKVNHWFSVDISRSGRVKVSTDGLDDAIGDLEEGLKESILEVKAFNEVIETERNELLSNPDKYTQSFTENVLGQLDQSLLDQAKVLTGGFSIENLDVELKYENKVRSYLSKYTNNEIVLDQLMQSYGDGLASLYQVKDTIDQLESDIKEDYVYELQSLEGLDRKDFYLEVNDLEDEIFEGLFEVFEDLEIEKNEVNKPRIPSKLNKEVEAIVDVGLLDDVNSIKTKTGINLPNARISNDVYKKLYSIKSGDQEDISVNALERVLLTEYLLGTFRNRLTDSHGLGLDFYGKMDREAFFEAGEVEYLLKGSPSESTNRQFVVNRIFLLREAANLLHVYTCKDKQQLAAELSSAVAWPVWLKPVIHNGLLVGWSTLESFEDINRLLDGEKIYTFKYHDDMWYTTLNTKSAVSAKDSTSSKSSNKLDLNKKVDLIKKDELGKKDENTDKNPVSNEQNYVFYLRILLNMDLGHSKQHILRSLDLIELNQSKTDGNQVSVDEYWTKFKINLDWESENVSHEVSY